ncbi:MAG: hypothetical protein PVI30_08555 [Myxococcales bacterium]|jgi:hypothetical protein
MTLAPAAEVRAQKAREPVVVLVQAGLTTADADGLREQLERTFGLAVVTPALDDLAKEMPNAMLAVTLDERGALHAVYWDEAGTYDVLDTPAPQAKQQHRVAATTLASALLRRHIEVLRAPAAPVPANLLDRRAERVVRAALLRVLQPQRPPGRLAIRMTAADF